MKEVERNPIDVLADEFVQRYRRGEQPSAHDYAARHPDLAEEIRDLFPAIVAMEQLKHRKLESGRQTASLNGVELKHLGDFRIIREIGRGGMGIVYEAEQQSLGRHVAVKVFPQLAKLDTKQLVRFQREAQTAARLHHTNIVPVYGVGQQDGFHYYAMQYIRGMGLESVLSELKRRERSRPDDSGATEPGSRVSSAAVAAQAMLNGTFAGPRKLGSTADRPLAVSPQVEPPSTTLRHPQSAETEIREGNPSLLDGPVAGDVLDESVDSAAGEAGTVPASRTLRGIAYWRTIARIGMQVADALQYAHTQGALHRDIKPANLLMDDHGAVWVTDFGLAKAIDDDSVTRTGDIVGTLRYMAPEQFEGQGDARSDVYSLGLTLYELATLRPAFHAETRHKLIQAVMDGEPPRPRGLCRELPRDLETVILKAIAREPADRYQTAGQLCEDLERFLEDRTILARRPNPAERLWRWCRRNKAVAALTLTAFAAMLLAAVLGWVGYVQTNKALAQVSQKHEVAVNATALAEDNLSLTLDAFEDIFDKLAGRDARLSLLPEDTESEDWGEPARQTVLTPENAELLQRMLAFYDQFVARNEGSTRLRRETARANRRVGDIHRNLGRLDQAERAYRKSLDIYGGLVAIAEDASKYRLEEAIVHNELGQLAARRRQHDAALRSHRRAETRLSESPHGIVAAPELLELARTYNFIAAVSRRTGDDDTRLHCSQQAISLLTGLIKRSPQEPEYQLALARSKLNQARSPFRRRGGSRGSRGDRGDRGDRSDRSDRGGSGRGTSPEPTVERYAVLDEALAILERLVEKFPDNPEYKLELAETYINTSYRYRRGDPEAGLDQLANGIRLIGELVDRHGNVPDYRLSLARGHNRTAMYLFSIRRSDEAVRHFGFAMDQQAELVSRYPKVDGYRISLAWIQYMIADHHRRRGEFAAARGLLDKSVAVMTPFRDKPATDANRMARGLILSQHVSLADVLDNLGEHELAQRAEEVAQQVRATLPASRVRRFGPAVERPE